MKVTRDTFLTDGQWRKFLKVRDFFEKLISLKKRGCVFLVDGDIKKTPFISGYEIGFKDNGCITAYVGATFAQNPETNEFDIPWVDVSVTELKKRIIPLKKCKI